MGGDTYKNILSITILFFCCVIWCVKEDEEVLLLDLAAQAKQSIIKTFDSNDRKQCELELNSRLKLLKKIINSSQSKLSKNNLKIKETAQLTRKFEKDYKK